MTKPVAVILTKFCASSVCRSVLTAVKDLKLGDCTLMGTKFESGLITSIHWLCQCQLHD